MIELLPIREESSWPEPEPLVASFDAVEFPIEAITGLIGDAISEVHGFVQAPIPLVVASALSAVSTALQAHINVERDSILTGPSSLYFLTIAESGERKSSCDGYFTKAILDYESEKRVEADEAFKVYRAELTSWEAKHAGIKSKIKDQAKKGDRTDLYDSQLFKLEQEKPIKPRVPRLQYQDCTIEELKFKLATDWPSALINASEGGIVLGSHSMGRDSVTRNLTTINELWSGGRITTDRKTSDSFVLENAKLSINLMVQESVLRQFIDSTGDQVRGSGFWARFLVSWPETTQGTRMFKPAPPTWPALERFNSRIARFLKKEPVFDDNGNLVTRPIVLSEQAKKGWISYHDQVESSLSVGGELADVRDFASKAADNLVRIAAILELFENPDSTQISESSLSSAWHLNTWYLDEAKRFVGQAAMPQPMLDAVQLDNWLIGYCKANGCTDVSRRDIQRRVTPTRLRDGARLSNALAELEQLSRVSRFDEGKRKLIIINPKLIEATDKGGQ